MREVQVVETGEKALSIFYKRKELSLEKTRQLQKMMEELMQENEETLAHEKLMLDKIREKDNAFIKRLEDHLERFKMAGIEKIILKPDLLPAWSEEKLPSDTADGNESPMIGDDTTDRLGEWYNAMTTYVSLQRDEVNQILGDWFSQMDKIASEGEPDAQFAAIKHDETVVESETNWENIIWCAAFVLVCVINVVIFYKPEAIKECADDGFYKCFIPYLVKFCAFVRDHYLKFHNITLDIASENSSTGDIVLYSSKSEL